MSYAESKDTAYFQIPWVQPKVSGQALSSGDIFCGMKKLVKKRKRKVDVDFWVNINIMHVFLILIMFDPHHLGIMNSSHVVVG